MGIEDAELIAVIDAMNRNIVANPLLDHMTIDVVDDDT